MGCPTEDVAVGDAIDDGAREIAAHELREASSSAATSASRRQRLARVTAPCAKTRTEVPGLSLQAPTGTADNASGGGQRCEVGTIQLLPVVAIGIHDPKLRWRRRWRPR